MGGRPGLLSVACTRVALLALVCSLVAACGKRPLVEMGAGTGVGGLVGGAGASGAGGVGATDAAGGASGGGDGRCAGGQGGTFPAQCTDGIDNDGDGKVDYDDPECTGGHDNDESSFAWGIPGDNSDYCKSDCFFDGNEGAGDDGCVWQRKCDPASTAPCPYDPAYAAAYPGLCSLTSSQTQGCVDRCRKIIPNGCDCFGCCTIPGLAGPVLLTYSCTAADFANPQRCPPCTQVTQCLNPCERCELCIGKPVLPDDCATSDGHAPYACPGSGIACGVYGIAPSCCPAGTSCVTGCCLPLDPLP